MSLTEAKQLGLERVLAQMADRPVEITKRGTSLGILFSAEHWDSVHAATVELNSSALRALAEMVERLSHDELMRMSDHVTGLLGIPGNLADG